MHKIISIMWILFQFIALAPGLGMDRVPNPGETLPGEEEEVRYTPRKLKVSLITARNCERRRDGSLARCRFPKIDLKEIYPHLPPLPYETFIEVDTSSSCKLTGPVGFLKMRMGEYNTPLQDPTPYLHSGQLAIQHSHIQTLKHPDSRPIGQLQISPGAKSIFLAEVFPPDCRITIEIEFNTIAIHTPFEGEKYLASLQAQIDLLKRSREVFRFMEDRRQEEHMLRGIANLLQGREVEVQGMRLEWDRLVQSFRNELDHSIHDVSTLFNRFFEDHAISFETIQNMIRAVAIDNVGDNGHAPDINFDQIADFQAKIEVAEHEFQAATALLNSINLEEAQKEYCKRDLRTIGYQVICEPHGVIDQIITSINQIGKSQ